jgi:hypothetical protein
MEGQGEREKERRKGKKKKKKNVYVNKGIRIITLLAKGLGDTLKRRILLD